MYIAPRCEPHTLYREQMTKATGAPVGPKAMLEAAEKALAKVTTN